MSGQKRSKLREQPFLWGFKNRHRSHRPVEPAELLDHTIMATAAAADQKPHLTCAVCQEVYRSPRFLPCHHSYCLKCLEQLAAANGQTIPCPICRKRAPVPAGGVQSLQVNFYFTDEELERARKASEHTTCRVHGEERLCFYCKPCERVICIKCKLTKHEGHVSEDLTETAEHCKEEIQRSWALMEDSVKIVTKKLHEVQKNNEAARQKCAAVKLQIKVRRDALVRKVDYWYDAAVKILDEVADSLEAGLGGDMQRVQHELNSLLRLKKRAEYALDAASDAEVVQVEKETREGRVSAEELNELQKGLPTTTLRPGLHGDFNNNIEDEIRRFIGAPVRLTLPCEKSDESVSRHIRCGQERECREVHAVRIRHDQRTDIAFGDTGGEHESETVSFLLPCGEELKEINFGSKVTFLTRHIFLREWKCLKQRVFGSKSDSQFVIRHEIGEDDCEVFRLGSKINEGKMEIEKGPTLFQPKIRRLHNFDANKAGELFAVIDDQAGADEQEDASSDKNKTVTDMDSGASKNLGKEKEWAALRVVQLYKNGQDEAIATYTPPVEPFFPTDVCFWRPNDEEKLLIADWMNDCVHVVAVAEDGTCRFQRYLAAGSGDIVRPTALNTDLEGRLLIGCGTGWVLRCECSSKEDAGLSDSEASSDEASGSEHSF